MAEINDKVLSKVMSELNQWKPESESWTDEGIKVITFKTGVNKLTVVMQELVGKHALRFEPLPFLDQLASTIVSIERRKTDPKYKEDPVIKFKDNGVPEEVNIDIAKKIIGEMGQTEYMPIVQAFFYLQKI